MSFLLASALFCAVCYIGFSLYNQKMRKKIFYEDCFYFLQNLNSEICFFQNKLDNILTSKKYHKDFDIFLVKIQQGLNKEENFNIWKKEQKLFQEDEAELILTFFKKLGHFDIYTQEKEIENFKLYIDEKVKDTKEEVNKKGKLNFSLSIMFGVALFIVVI